MVSLYADSPPRTRTTLTVALVLSFLAICPLALITIGIGLFAAAWGGLDLPASIFLGLGATCLLAQISLLFLLFVPWRKRGRAALTGVWTSTLFVISFGCFVAAHTIDGLDQFLIVMFASWALPVLYLSISGLKRLS